MIEVKFIPVFGIMTFIALFTEFAFVRVVLAMTVEASGWRFRELFIRLMAGSTGRVLMAALKMEIRVIMIESCVVQNDYIGIPADMIGMAYLAGCLRDFSTQAMKALTGQ